MSEDVSAKSLIRTVNGRRFRLEEYTLAETGQFMDAINAGVAADTAAWQVAGEVGMTEVFERVAASLEGVFEVILRHPIDGKPAPDHAFISCLKLTQRKRLLELQSELNGLEDAAYSKKVYAVLLAVSAWRTASGFAPLPGNAATPLRTTTDSTPEASRRPGLLAKLRGLWRSWRGASGAKTSATSL